jgi:hypothetical protein
MEELIMAKSSNSITASYEALPKIIKIIIQLLLGSIVGGVYRIIRFFETKNIITLIVGLLVTFTGIGNLIAWIVDIVTEICFNKICILAA